MLLRVPALWEQVRLFARHIVEIIHVATRTMHAPHHLLSAACAFQADAWEQSAQ